MSTKAPDSIEPYLIEINGRTSIEVDPAQLNAETIRLEHVRGPEYVLHYDGRTVEIILEEHDRRNVRITSGHKTFDIKISDHRDQLLSSWGMKDGEVAPESNIIAPMPGLVLDIQVDVGQRVESGDVLMVLEAMKMENEIRAASEGVVKSIAIQKGDAVQKAQVLMEFDPLAT